MNVGSAPSEPASAVCAIASAALVTRLGSSPKFSRVRTQKTNPFRSTTARVTSLFARRISASPEVISSRLPFDCLARSSSHFFIAASSLTAAKITAVSSS